jgi:predicted metal-dependent phosphoesterase TrpH
VDLHVHTSASFDSIASPESIVRAAAMRGLTHVAITDHDRIEGALAAREIARTAAPELTVIVGQEVRTRDGDLIGAFLEKDVPSDLPPAEAIAEIRDQGGLVGIPHPFDRFRGSLLDEELLASIAAFALAHDLPGVAVSDAHSAMEIGVAYVALEGDPSSAAGLLAALRSAELVPGRATYFVRAITPIAKLIQTVRGNGRQLSAR